MQRWEYCNLSGTLTPEEGQTGHVTWTGHIAIFTPEGMNTTVIEDDNLVPACARLGRDGWELVSVTRTLDPPTLITVYTFKRPLPADEA